MTDPINQPTAIGAAHEYVALKNTLRHEIMHFTEAKRKAIHAIFQDEYTNAPKEIKEDAEDPLVAIVQDKQWEKKKELTQ